MNTKLMKMRCCCQVLTKPSLDKSMYKSKFTKILPNPVQVLAYTGGHWVPVTTLSFWSPWKVRLMIHGKKICMARPCLPWDLCQCKIYLEYLKSPVNVVKLSLAAEDDLLWLQPPPWCVLHGSVVDVWHWDTSTAGTAYLLGLLKHHPQVLQDILYTCSGIRRN